MRRSTLTLEVCLITVLAVAQGCNSSKRTGPTYESGFDPLNFSGDPVTNPLLPMTPGVIYTYEVETEDGTETIVVEVMPSTRTVAGVVATVLRDRVYLEGELIEDTYDWYAQDVDGNVWYLGEDSKEMEGGQVVSTAGSWETGVDGAQPGIMMWADPTAHIGEDYRQEYYKSKAEDWARVISANHTVTVAYGSFNGCLLTEEWNALERNSTEEKYYCPGIGGTLEVMVDSGGERVELTSVTGL